MYNSKLRSETEKRLFLVTCLARRRIFSRFIFRLQWLHPSASALCSARASHRQQAAVQSRHQQLLANGGIGRAAHGPHQMPGSPALPNMVPKKDIMMITMAPVSRDAQANGTSRLNPISYAFVPASTVSAAPEGWTEGLVATEPG